MIPRLEGWSFCWIGDAVHLTSRDGEITYFERLRPVAPALRLAHAFLAGVDDFEVHEVGEEEILQTSEGEWASLVTIRGALRGAVTQLDLGFVFGDDFYARVVGVCGDEAQFATFTETVRRLVRADEHVLGVRRRPCRFRAPIGWDGRMRGLENIFAAPGGEATLYVAPAVPVGARSPGYVDAALDRGSASGPVVMEDAKDPRPISTPFGLHGNVWDVSGQQGDERIHRRVVICEDDRYTYTVRMDANSAAALEEHELAFLQLVHSLERVPGSSRASKAASSEELVGHWL